LVVTLLLALLVSVYCVCFARDGVCLSMSASNLAASLGIGGALAILLLLPLTPLRDIKTRKLGGATAQPHSAPPRQKPLGVLSASVVRSLSPWGQLYYRRLHLYPIIVHKAPGDDGNLTLALNKCKHQGGRFIRDIEESGSIITCTRHGWKLDACTLEYKEPAGCHRQPELPYELLADGSVAVFAPVTGSPWDEGVQQQREALAPGEMTVTFLNHACVEVKAGASRLVSDPWLLGPAFARGWWLLFKSPKDALRRVAEADAIWLSHSHPDHLNIPTLRELVKHNPDVPIFYADLEVPMLSPEFHALGFTNVRAVSINTWIPLGRPEDGARFMILLDSLLPHLDTSILLEYKGHRVINLVDCSRPNDDHLPEADVLLTDFASGASGFPALFSDMHGPDKCKAIADGKARNFLNKLSSHMHTMRPGVWIPFAGYFTEAAPGDELVRELNRKNTPASAYDILRERHPDLRAWFPFPGGVYDVGTAAGETPPRPMETYLETEWDFETYLHPLRESLLYKPLQTLGGVAQYYSWAGFADYDLILHIVETDDFFEETFREYMLDFSGKSTVFVNAAPPGRPLLRIRVRASVLRDLYRHGRSWDNIYIGFSGHFFASPDIYHFKFLDHFSNRLPEGPPVYE
jgi:CMP-N-acetylneuraminate monooxygenase